MKQEELFKPSQGLVEKTKALSADILKALIKRLQKIEKDGRTTDYVSVVKELRDTIRWLEDIWGRN